MSTPRRLAPAFLLVALLAAPAAADGWGCGCDRGARRSPCDGARGYAGRVFRRDGCYEGRHLARFGARGSSWILLRRGLYRTPGIYRHLHPRVFFLDRWGPTPWCRDDAPPAWHDQVCAGEDVGPDACPLATAAFDEDAPEPAPAERLARGLERLHRGDLEGAREDFDAARRHDAEDARAVYGLALCATFDKDWHTAATLVRRLHALGELRAEDRLDVESTFAVAADLEGLRRGLSDYTRWSFMETDAQLVAAWLALSTGDVGAARGHLAAVLRFAPDDAAARQLKGSMDGPPSPRPEAVPSPPPAPPAPPPATLARTAPPQPG